MADGTYESDLHQAILQSKLDYEENKELYDQLKKEQEEEGKKPAKKKKSNKAQPMTLGPVSYTHLDVYKRQGII